MRRTLVIMVTALAAAVMLIPAAAQARGSHHKASAADKNRDRIPDRWERRHRLSLRVKQTKRDQDRDGLNNLAEYRHDTDPRDSDSDDDGVKDGTECRHGLDPNDRDSDDDGVKDNHENAGSVVSFDGDVLTIKLVNGETVTGHVTDATEIECEAAPTTTPTARATRDGESGDDNSGDNENDNENENENEQHGNCSKTDLAPDAVVKEAELKATSTGAVFHSVHLVK